jgi:predicted nucleic acid-binding protein
MVDTCVLLDVITEDAMWAPWAAERLGSARDQGELVINPIIYAEVAAGYNTIEAPDSALPAADFHREPLPYNAGFLASRAFKTYRNGGGMRRSPPPDFYIGAHAAVSGYPLITRDVRRYRSYFPNLRLISPPR